MTSAGNINLGVEIDATDIRSELTEAVRAAMLPVLLEMQKDLRGVQDEYGDTATAARRSATSQRSSAKNVEQGIHGITNEQRKQAASASATGLASVRSLKSQTRAVDEQARAWDRLAAAKARAAAIPDSDAPRGPPRTPRGGGGRGGGGGAFGDLFTGQGGGGRFITSPVGLNTIALGASGIPAATTAVVNLVGAIQQLSQASLALPGIVASIGASAATAAIGFHGLGDAIEKTWEATRTGDPKDIKKMNEELEKLSPAAAAVATKIGRDLQPALRSLRTEVQENMFAGVADDLQVLADKQLPNVSRNLRLTSQAWNDSIREILRVAGSDKVSGIMDRIFGNTAEGQKRANAAIEPLVSAFGELAAVGTDFIPRLADGLTGLANRFDRFIQSASASGDLAKWIDEGFVAAGNLGEAMLNVGKIITDLTKAAGGDGGFLKWLRDATARLHEFLASDEGQAKLTAFFNEGKETLREWLPVLRDLAKLGIQVGQGFAQWGSIMLPVLAQILETLNSMPGAVTAVVTAFLAWRTISGITGALAGIKNIGGALDALPGKAGLAAGGINKALGGLAIGGAAFSIGSNLVNSDSGLQQAGGAALNIGGGALAGGMIAGPWGAALGAMIGAGVTLFEFSKKRLDEGKAEWDAAWQEQHDNPKPPVIAGGMDLQTRLPVDRGPSLSQGMLAQIQAGQLPGYSIGPNGAVIGPDGQPLPINLGGVTPYTAPVPTPPPPPPPPEPPKLPTTFLPVPGAATQNIPVPQGGNLGQLIGAGALPEVQANVQKLASDIQALPEGEVKIKDPSPELIKGLEGVDAKITQVSENEIQVKANTDLAKQQVDAFVLQYKQQTITLMIQAQNGGGPALPPGRADGGVLPGWSPGRDNMLVPMSGGEGVLIPEAVRGLGGSAAIYAINSRFRTGLSKQGYADGGVVGGVPGMDDNTELGVLRQIRDLLSGKGSGPLSETARGVGELAKGEGLPGGAGGGGTKMGPFGTPLKQRNAGYDAAAAAIRALGGDPEVFLGMDPAKLSTAQGGMLPPRGGLRGAGDPSRFVAALQAFARSGAISDLGGTGLGAGDSIVKALVTARNKKTGMSDDQIAQLIQEVLGGGGFTGTLTPSNSSLVGSLESFRKKAIKNGYGTTLAPAGGIDAALLANVPAGQYSQTGSADLTKGLADCSSSVEDLVNQLDGRPTAGRSLATGNADQWLTERGFVKGTGGLGDMRVAFNSGHMQATLPDGTPFNWGSDAAAANRGIGGTGADDPALTSRYFRPVTDMPAGGLLATTGAGGTPVFVTNWPGQGQGGIGGNILGGALTGAGQAGSNVAGDVLSGIAGGLGPTGQRAPSADLLKLVKERNPMALLAAMGFDIQDFSSAGGGGDDFQRIDKPFDASGRMFSDTASLSDRTTASIWGQLDAMRKQLSDAIDQVADKLTEDALKPIVESAIQSGLEGLKDSVMSGIGTSLGQAAGPPIADAVRSAMPSDAGNAGSGVVESVAGAAFATGGPVGGLFTGGDTVPAMLTPGEHVFTRDDVARMGGQNNVYAFRRALRNGGVRGFATGGGVNVNDTVGAEFFGVSEVPIISTIVNLLVRVLLKVLGVEIEARDTLNEMTDNFRQFRGDFKAFDASGRMMNDTSALVDRSSTSEATAAAERIRILKIVIEALIKYIIEKVIVPIGKAVANTAFSAAGSAAGAAVNTQAPGAGGIVSAAISSAGAAATDIVAEIGSDLAIAITSVAVEAIGEAIMSYFPDLANMLFGGGALESFLIGPLTSFITDPILGAIGGIFSLFGGLFGGLSSVIPGLPFDEGGLATGVGLMPKATIKPERVLSPSQTQMWDRMIAALERGGNTGSQRTIEVHAPITVLGGTDAGAAVQQSILDMVNG